MLEFFWGALLIPDSVEVAIRMRWFYTLSIAALLGLVGVVQASEVAPANTVKNPDPWMGLNRGINSFNTVLDDAVLRPVAKGYRWIMPDPFEQGVSNVFDNLQTPGIALNQILQGKPGDSANDIGRFLLNSTFGVLGLFDVASQLGFRQHQEDFGQTLVKWGVPQGPYFIIPLRGPSTVTAATGMIFDAFTNPIRLINDRTVRYSVYALYFIDLRQRLLSAEALVSGDEYLFIRDAYLQSRTFAINDGVIEDDPFMDFEDF